MPGSNTVFRELMGRLVLLGGQSLRTHQKPGFWPKCQWRRLHFDGSTRTLRRPPTPRKIVNDNCHPLNAYTRKLLVVLVFTRLSALSSLGSQTWENASRTRIQMSRTTMVIRLFLLSFFVWGELKKRHLLLLFVRAGLRLDRTGHAIST
jgi:hypothetical protein